MQQKVTQLVALVSVYKTRLPENKMYHRFMYELLKERDESINISHIEMPTFEDHVKFVESEPYKEWYIIYDHSMASTPIGTIYLSNNDEVGIFIKKSCQSMGYGSSALEYMLENRVSIHEPVYANINPRNQKSIDFFTSRGFELLNVHPKHNIYVRAI